MKIFFHIATAIFTVLLIAACAQADDPKMPESGELVNMISNVIYGADVHVIHDDARGVTCWAFTYNGAAISCLADKSFEVQP